MRKRLFPILLALALLLSGCRSTLSSSRAQAPEDPGLTAAQVLRAMLESCPERGEGPEAVPQEEVGAQVEAFYGLAGDQFDDAAIVRLGGARAFELAVIHLTEGADMEAAQDGLQAYLDARQGDFTGYAPDQAELAANGHVASSGRYVALAICENAENAAFTFANCFDDVVTVMGPPPAESGNPAMGRYPYTDPKRDDMTLYDTSAILAAWESGDRSALSAKDGAILEAAEAALAEALTAGMTDYEKEEALYSWVTLHMEYDWGHQDPRAKMDPDSVNPYGGLVNGKGICLGFATTFQLLMDMAGVECIIVTGAAFRSTENHAWNMVRLDGAWYCVDATWDEAVSDPLFWQYFNVTSDWMAETDHQWDYKSVPEATYTKTR